MVIRILEGARVTSRAKVAEHAGGVHVGKDVVDVDAGGPDIMFGRASEETELRHASRTPDGKSFEEEIDRRPGKKWNDGRKNGDLWWLRPRASRGFARRQG